MDGEASETVVRVTPSARRAEEWATVLAASGIRHRLALTDSGWAIVVADGDSRRASAALAAYDEENRPEIRVPASPIGWDSIAVGSAVAVLLLGFYAFTGSACSRHLLVRARQRVGRAHPARRGLADRHRRSRSTPTWRTCSATRSRASS